jgi:hypothetical protein
MENDKKKLASLFLIPSSLDQNAIYDFMVEEQRKRIKDLTYFIVENEKSARKIKLVYTYPRIDNHPSQ